MLSIPPPTECSLAITSPSAQLSNKDGATTHSQGLLGNVKVPETSWILKSKSEEFTPDQIVTEITRNRMKIDRTVARILETFDWYFTSRLIAVIDQFKK